MSSVYIQKIKMLLPQKLTYSNFGNVDLSSLSEQSIEGFTAIENPKNKKFLTRRDQLALGVCYELGDSFPCLDSAYTSVSENIPDAYIPYMESMGGCIDIESGVFDQDKFGQIAETKLNPILALKVLPNAALSHICQSLNITYQNGNFLFFKDALYEAYFDLKEGRSKGAVVVFSHAPCMPYYKNNRKYVGEHTFECACAVVLSLESKSALFELKVDIFSETTPVSIPKSSLWVDLFHSLSKNGKCEYENVSVLTP